MRKFIALSALTLTATTMTAQNIAYPKAPKDGTVDTYFGVKVPDPYRPLEADRSQETMAWVEAENKVTNAYLEKIPFRAKLLKRLKEVADFEKVGTPFNKNGKWYVYKNNGLQNQSVLHQMDELGGQLNEFLDPNKLSDDGTVALQSTSFSHLAQWQRLAGNIREGRCNGRTAVRPYRMGEVWRRAMVRQRLLLQCLRCSRKGKGVQFKERSAQGLLPQDRHETERRRIVLSESSPPTALLLGVAERGRNHDVPQ